MLKDDLCDLFGANRGLVVKSVTQLEGLSVLTNFMKLISTLSSILNKITLMVSYYKSELLDSNKFDERKNDG